MPSTHLHSFRAPVRDPAAVTIQLRALRRHQKLSARSFTLKLPATQHNNDCSVASHTDWLCSVSGCLGTYIHIYIYTYIYIYIYMIQVRPSPPSPPPQWLVAPQTCCFALFPSAPLPPPPVVWCGVVVPALACTVPLPPVGWCGVVVPAARPLLQQQRHQRHHHHHHHHPWLVPPQTRCIAGFCAPLPCGVVWLPPPVVRPLLQQHQYPQVRSLHCHKDRLCLTVDGFGFDS